MPAEQFETVLFKKKTFGNILEEIHNKSQENDKRIIGLIEDMKEFIQSVGDAITLAPIIATYVKLSIDNNDHLIKMAAIAQKCLDKGKETGDFGLSDSDREQLEQLALDYQEQLKLPKPKELEKLKR
jgi:hypothetical protein